jgi:glycosyltransferase involved in cell wall biosynthesis
MSDRHHSGRLHHRLLQWWRYERTARANARANRALLPELVQVLRDRGVQLVHGNSSAAGIAPFLARAAQLPFVWHIRELPERQYLLHLDAGKRRYAQALRSADRLIAISDAVEADIRRYAGAAAKVSLVRNGVLRRARYEELRAESAPRWSATAPFRFALVGLIHPSKGQEEAIRALALVRREVPNVELVLAGNGNATRLERLIDELGLQAAVRLVGFVPSPFAVYRDAHVSLMCSRNEAMGRVTVEAMASGLPVIGHASGGTPEIVQDGRNGLLYPGGHEALAERMLRLARDPSLARRLGDEASCYAEGRFTIERYAEEVREVYSAVFSASAHR